MHCLTKIASLHPFPSHSKFFSCQCCHLETFRLHPLPSCLVPSAMPSPYLYACRRAPDCPALRSLFSDYRPFINAIHSCALLSRLRLVIKAESPHASSARLKAQKTEAAFQQAKAAIGHRLSAVQLADMAARAKARQERQERQERREVRRGGDEGLTVYEGGCL